MNFFKKMYRKAHIKKERIQKEYMLSEKIKMPIILGKFDCRISNENVLIFHWVGVKFAPSIDIYFYKLNNQSKKISIHSLKDEKPIRIIKNISIYSVYKFLSDECFICETIEKIDFFSFSTGKKIYTLKEENNRYRQTKLISKTTFALCDLLPNQVQIRNLKDGRLLKKLKSNLSIVTLTKLNKNEIIVFDIKGCYEVLDVKSGYIEEGRVPEQIVKLFDVICNPKAEQVAIICETREGQFTLFFDLKKGEIFDRIQLVATYQLNPLWQQYTIEPIFKKYLEDNPVSEQSYNKF